MPKTSLSSPMQPPIVATHTTSRHAGLAIFGSSLAAPRSMGGKCNPPRFGQRIGQPPFTAGLSEVGSTRGYPCCGCSGHGWLEGCRDRPNRLWILAAHGRHRFRSHRPGAAHRTTGRLHAVFPKVQKNVQMVTGAELAGLPRPSRPAWLVLVRGWPTTGLVRCVTLAYVSRNNQPDRRREGQTDHPNVRISHPSELRSNPSPTRRLPWIRGGVRRSAGKSRPLPPWSRTHSESVRL